MAHFVWHFDAGYVEDEQPEPYYKDAFVAMRGTLPLQTRPSDGNLLRLIKA
jgi:hypothetical protein